MMTLDATVALSETAVFRELDGEAVILDLDSGRYFGLDPVGTRTWQLMASGASLRGVHSALAAEFDAAPDVIAADLLAFAGELAARGLVVALPSHT